MFSYDLTEMDSELKLNKPIEIFIKNGFKPIYALKIQKLV